MNRVQGPVRGCSVVWYKYDGVVLKDAGRVAISEECCCGGQTRCPCCDYYPPRILKLTFTDATDRASCLEGVEVELIWGNYGTVPGATLPDTWCWQGFLDTPVWTLCPEDCYYEFRLGCNRAASDPECTGQTFWLAVIKWCDSYGSEYPDYDFWDFPDADRSHCKSEGVPFELVYWYFYNTYDEGCQPCTTSPYPLGGVADMIITEP
jgi:hypothetical protein